MPDPLDRLRNATEDDVIAALDGAYVAFPLTDPAQVLETLQKLIDHLCGEVES